MKKVALLLAILCAIVVSCSKTVKEPVSYTVEHPTSNPLPDVFIPDSGTYDLAAMVKFLSGTNEDKVTVVLKGLPADVTVEKDTISGLPTFTADFILHTNHAAQAKYPVSIVATAPGSAQKHYDFNLTVIPADCAAYLFGDYTAVNACTARTYSYTATASATGAPNTMNISNFGGYGITTSTRVNINCSNDSLSIPYQNIGNGTTVSGYGVFVANQITLYYTASNTPTGISETCSVALTR